MDHPLQQPIIAISFLYCGIIMGITFDCFSWIYNFLRRNVLRYLLDSITATVLWSMFFVVSFYTTGGTLRLYPFLITAIGFWLEQQTLSTLVCAKRFQRIHKSASHS